MDKTSIMTIYVDKEAKEEDEEDIVDMLEVTVKSEHITVVGRSEITEIVEEE